LKGHVSIKKTCAGNVILFIMAAPKVGKGIVGKVGNVGVGKVGFPSFPKRGKKVVASPKHAQDTAMHEHLQKAVDPRKLASSKVHTVTMPLLAHP
jgi:hypothetical protein